MTRVLRTRAELRTALADVPRPVGLVPTMGWLHEGHRALMRRARAENAIFRYKRLLGSRLRARDCDSQRVEARLSCGVLNRMAELGAAQSYSIGR